MRLKALDGWRGLACLLVALYHLNVAHSLWTAPWLVHPDVVLELFFVLSGFVMAMGFADSIQNARTFIAFLIHRFGRGLPVHLFTLALLLALVGVKTLLGSNHGGFNAILRPEALIPQLFAMQTIAGHGISWNYPAWTLSAELVAYVVFALLVGLTRSRAIRFVGAAAIMLVSAFMFHADLTAPDAPLNVISVTRCFTAFFLGFILYDVWRALPTPSPRMATVLQIVAVLVIAACLALHLRGAAFFVNHLAAAAVILAFANDQGLLGRMMSIPPLLWLGNLSFSLYMIHAVIMMYLQTAFYALERVTGRDFVSTYVTPMGAPRDMISLGPVWANDLLMLAYMGAVIGGAVLLFRWVEGPARRASSDLAGRYKRRDLKLSWTGAAAWWADGKRGATRQPS